MHEITKRLKRRHVLDSGISGVHTKCKQVHMQPLQGPLKEGIH
jgi:hypothetical protein